MAEPNEVRPDAGPLPLPSIRCAIYTRKSTEEGLQQPFNSLMAQREAAAAYILSQREQGWKAVADPYDDGGFSGGNLDRPALTRLLLDVRAGRVDCVVVYKVDRLSRSLLDFARIIGILDEHQVSFVSVTQQFNTHTSLGRLTLNVLLSFAQFEREIISERTRDKIRAARRQGRWTGGYPVLGYDVDPDGGGLLVNPQEACQVRQTCELFLQKRTLGATLGELQERGWITKSWSTRSGKAYAGKPFTTHSLRRLLLNPVYIGQVHLQGELHPGQHPAMIERPLWEQVRQLLGAGARGGSRSHCPSREVLLRGLLFCAACGSPMVPTHGHQTKRKSSYYVCLSGQSRGSDTCPSGLLNARLLEHMVVERIGRLFPDADGTGPDDDPNAWLHAIIERISYDGLTRGVSITLRGAEHPARDKGRNAACAKS